ncbi:reverse transcriptase domain-containing protein [Tanacetum coccineum]
MPKIEPGDGVTSYTRRRHNSSSDGVTSFMMASARTDSNADLEDSSYDGKSYDDRIVDVINDNIRGDVSRGCTYKEFLAYNPKEYDGKGGAIVYTCWIEKMESVYDISGCRDSQRVKYTAGSFVGKALTWWNSEIHTRGRVADVGMIWEDFRTLTREEFCPSNEMQKLETELWNHAMVGASHVAYTDRFHELAGLVPHLVTPEGKKIERYVYGLASQIHGMVAATEPKTIQKAMQLAGTLTDESLRNGSIKKNLKKRGNVGEPRGYTGTTPKCTACGYHHSPETPYCSCLNCNRLGYFSKDCRVAPRNVNPINARNPVARTCFECGSIDHIKSACLGINQDQRLGETNRTKLWLLMGVRVMETKGIKLRVGKGGRGRRPREGNDERVDDLNGQENDQGLGANGGNGNVVNENVQKNVENVLVNGNQICMLSWEVAVSMSWNDFKFTTIEEFCPSYEMQKLETELWNHVMVGAGHATYSDRFHELARLVPYLVTLESKKIERYVYGLAPQIHGMVAATEPKNIQKAMQIYGTLTDEAVKNESIKKVEKRGNVEEPSKDKSGRDDNKRTRTRTAFAASPVGRENMGAWPKCTTCNSNHAPGGPCRI